MSEEQSESTSLIAAPTAALAENAGANLAMAIDGGQAETRPVKFTMRVQGGMLEALGINMYTSIGKCLVEFVANSYDSEATFCNITLPFDAIDAARASVRENAKQDVREGKRVAFTVLLDPLPEDITIVIEDDGHGMSAPEVQEKFLPLNRHRRGTDNGHPKTETGLRYAMGRKGLGKLAGFGAAERVTIRTKRAGQTYATEIRMDYSDLAMRPDIHDFELPYKYIEDQPSEVHGTTVTLSGLRCDALKSKASTIAESLLDGFFGILPDDFTMRLNSPDPLKAHEAFYEFVYPAALDADGFGAHTINLDDGESFDIRYVVKFRGRTEDEYDRSDTRERGPLVAKRRGARVYCNRRLAAGPTLFDLKTSMHNFHSQSYLECIVEADELDKNNVDLINTNRSDFRRDNEIVDTFVAGVTELMRQALWEHSKYRDAKADEDLAKADKARFAMRMLEHVSAGQSKSAKAVLRRLASEYGVNSDAFEETAPLVVNSMNAGKVLIRLMELGTDPHDLATVAGELLKLRGIEMNDALKLYKGRRNGIAALQTLADRADDEWKSSGRYEKELHKLLKDNPWLVRAEYTGYLTSNQTMGTIAKRLSKELAVDEYAGEVPDEATRPDLVSVLQDSIDTHAIVVIELKSPNMPLDQDAESQLVRYMEQIRVIMRASGGEHVLVRGFLVGSLPEATTNKPKELVLLNDYRKQHADSEVQIISLHDMLRDSYTIYVDAIRAIETAEFFDDQTGGETNGSAPGAAEPASDEVVRAVTPVGSPRPVQSVTPS